MRSQTCANDRPENAGVRLCCCFSPRSKQWCPIWSFCSWHFYLKVNCSVLFFSFLFGFVCAPLFHILLIAFAHLLFTRCFIGKFFILSRCVNHYKSIQIDFIIWKIKRRRYFLRLPFAIRMATISLSSAPIYGYFHYQPQNDSFLRSNFRLK